MADDLPRVLSSGPGISPDEVAGRAFRLTRRGFDPDEVRSFLTRLAHEFKRLVEREDSLRRLLADAEDRASHPEVDESTITAALGQEAARILRSAHEAASDVRARAEESVARILREAHEQAAAVRGEADAILGTKTAEAEAAAATIRRSAETEAATAVARARREADETVESVKGQCRSMLDEAQELRAKVLGDLARRRRVMHTQVEQLRAGRETLLETLRDAQRTIDSIGEGVRRAETDARLAADAAARRVANEPDASLEDLEEAAAALETLEEKPALEAGEPEAAPAAMAPTVSEAPPAAEAAPEPAGPSPVPAAPPEPAEPVTIEERRLSSLRILRRSHPERPATEQPAVPLPPDEGIRVIGPAPPAEPSPAPPDSPASPASPDLEEPAAAAALEVEEPAPPESPELPEPPERGRPTVDDIFARLRAGRQEALAEATRVLATPKPDASPTPAKRPARTKPDPTPIAVAAPEEAPTPENAAPPEEGAVPEKAVPDGVEVLLQRRDQAVAEIETRLARRLKRILQDDQNDLLDRTRAEPSRSNPALLLDDPDAQVKRVADALSEHMVDAARVGAEQGAAAFGVPAASVNGETVGGLALDVARAVVQPLRRRLERAVREGADDDAVLVDGISAAYREWKGKRVERLAGDAVAAAFARGQLEGVPEGQRLRWIVDDLDGDCPDCDDNALAGPTLRGETYPTGQTHPPAHGGCRCLLVPATT